MKRITQKQAREMGDEELVINFGDYHQSAQRVFDAWESLPGGYDSQARKALDLAEANTNTLRAELLRRLAK